MENRAIVKTNGGANGTRPARPVVTQPSPMEVLGDVARDAFDHAQVIVRDSVELGKLEARRAIQRAEESVAEIGPRIAWGLVAATFGFVGAIFAFIAIFMGL